MLMKKEDIKQILCKVFDMGTQRPLEMMEQTINIVMKEIKNTNVLNTKDISSWGWGDYHNALSQNDPWEQYKK